ncbi:hypothetical protein HDU96_005922 [Phlyctochytrium bullatum]|nr:hypothetical protein HDU96_005922 [Phlyctochytrium bullatum]
MASYPNHRLVKHSVASISTEVSSLFTTMSHSPATPLSPETAPISGTHILQVFNRIKKRNHGPRPSYHWRTLRPISVVVPESPKDAPDSPTSPVADEKPAAAKAALGAGGPKRDAPNARSPPSSPNPSSLAAKAYQYQDMGMYAFLPPKSAATALAQPRPSRPSEPVHPTAYFLRVTRVGQTGAAGDALHFTVTTVEAERLASRSTFFYFLEKQHEDALLKALQVNTPSVRRAAETSPLMSNLGRSRSSPADARKSPASPVPLRSPPATTSPVDSKWIIQSLMPNKPDFPPPTFHLTVSNPNDFGLLLDWLKCSKARDRSARLRAGLGDGTTRPYIATSRFIGLVADAHRLGVIPDIYKALAVWLYDAWEPAGFFHEERFNPTHVPEEMVVAAAAWARRRDDLHRTIDMCVQWSGGNQTVVLRLIQRAHEMLQNRKKRPTAAAVLAGRRDSVSRKLYDLAVKHAREEPHARKVESYAEPFEIVKKSRESAFYDDVKSVISAYRRGDVEDAEEDPTGVELEDDEDDDNVDSGVSVSSSPVTSLCLSDGVPELAEGAYDEGPRASAARGTPHPPSQRFNFFDHLHRLAVESEVLGDIDEDDTRSGSRALLSPASRRKASQGLSDAILFAALEYKRWDDERRQRSPVDSPRSSTASPTGSPSPTPSGAPGMSRSKTSSPGGAYQPMRSSPLSPIGAGAGVFAGFDDDSDSEDEARDPKSLKQLLLRRNNSVGTTPLTPPPRTASSGPFAGRSLKEEVIMTSVVVVRDWQGKVVNTCVYAWRSDDEDTM